MIREARESDLDDIFEIEVGTIDPWTFGILEADYKNESTNYFVYEVDNEVVGYISLLNLASEIHINNIAVDIDYRNKGIATSLVEYGIEYFKDKDILGYTLEVREDNYPAIKVYEKSGFKAVGIRKNYYSNNKSAIIMWKYIGE